MDKIIRFLNKLEKVLIVLIIFFLGVMFTEFLHTNPMAENPFGNFQYSEQTIPQDRISRENIQILPDKIIITIENASISEYANTGSMLPIIDTGANGIRIIPESEDSIKVGDIVTFEYQNRLVVHRVVSIGHDSIGKYFITKGDNNFFSDDKIRFKQIRYLTVGVLY